MTIPSKPRTDMVLLSIGPGSRKLLIRRCFENHARHNTKAFQESKQAKSVFPQPDWTLFGLPNTPKVLPSKDLL
jgi:hypothetical protein